MLVLLYYLSQNPNFSESVKPIMEKLKNSEEMLRFLKDLSQFSQTFSTFACRTGKRNDAPANEEKQDKEQDKGQECKKEPQSPTASIADEFIQTVLENYLNNRKT